MNPNIIRFFRERNACLPVSGESMNPVLKNGDQISIIHQSPRIGNIALFFRGGMFYIHRVVWKKGDFFYTIGDNSPVPDHPVHEQDIIGVLEHSPRRFFSVCSGLFRMCIYHLKNLIRSAFQAYNG